MISEGMMQPRLRIPWHVSCAVPIVLCSMLLLSGCGGSKSSANIITGGGGGVTGGVPGPFFGMHINFPNTPWPNQSFTGLRMWDDASSWALVNTGPGTYDWTQIDSWLQQAQAHNADVLYDLARTPIWAQCAPSDTSCGSGDTSAVCAYSQLSSGGGAGQCFPPNDLKVDGTGTNQIWINWVTDLATHSVNSNSVHIKYYEIWNEPNDASFWQGTTAQLVRMAQDAQCIIQGKNCSSLSTYSKTGIDPSASLVSPAFTGTASSDVVTAISSYLQAGGGKYADVIAFHGYLGQNPPEQVATVSSNLSSVLQAQAVSKPIFNTEGSWGINNPITDPDRQAAWLSRYVLLQVSLGVSRFYWYSWDVPGVDLWDKNNGTTTPAGIAYGELTKWVTGATFTGCSQQNTVWSCGFTRSGGYQALAVWDTSQTCSNGSCTTATYSAPSQYTQYLDVAGNTNSVSGGSISVGIKPILLETGNIP